MIDVYLSISILENWIQEPINQNWYDKNFDFVGCSLVINDIKPTFNDIKDVGTDSPIVSIKIFRAKISSCDSDNNFFLKNENSKNTSLSWITHCPLRNQILWGEFFFFEN